MRITCVNNCGDSGQQTLSSRCLRMGHKCNEKPGYSSHSLMQGTMGLWAVVYLDAIRDSSTHFSSVCAQCEMCNECFMLWCNESYMNGIIRIHDVNQDTFYFFCYKLQFILDNYSFTFLFNWVLDCTLVDTVPNEFFLNLETSNYRNALRGGNRMISKFTLPPRFTGGDLKQLYNLESKPPDSVCP